jgi:hypothetical protein
MQVTQLRVNLILVVWLSLSSLLSCKSKLAEPEATDLIYLDLKKQEATSEKEYEDAIKQLAEDEKKLKESVPNSLELKQLRKEMESVSVKRNRTQQMAHFFHIRAEKRKFEARVSYNDAFSKNEEWPPKGEYESYLKNQSLRNISMDWQTHVPSLTDRYSKNTQQKTKQEASKGEKDGE